MRKFCINSVKGVVSSDWHLRKDVPIARPETEEEWSKFQFNRVLELLTFAEVKQLPVYMDGDLYHRSQPYYGIVSKLQDTLNGFSYSFYRLAGNHDLPYLCFANALNSGWYVSPGIDMAIVYNGAFHFGEKPSSYRDKIVFTHQLVFPDEKSRPLGDKGKTASELLEEFPAAKWIFTGDYHKHFHYEEGGRHVVNPGCLTRQSAGEEDYVTGFYEVDTEIDFVKFHKLKDNVQMITEHIEIVKERENRLSAFMEKIESTEKVSFSYSDNLNKKLRLKAVTKGVKSIITEIQTEIEIGVSK